MFTTEIYIKPEYCATTSAIEFHKVEATKCFNETVSKNIDNFMQTNEEETYVINESEFGDTWTFALVMGLCGTHYFGTNTAIAYGRADKDREASISVINKIIKYNRLSEEISRLHEKAKNMEAGSSKYIKTAEKIEKLLIEAEKYKPVNIE